tara:strand:+ start:267 stop:770 length:504 start_codon:yes stop_codon:yes gene_type:complete
MASEEAKYDIIKKNDIYEIRYYSDRLIVQVASKGDNSSFRKLFKYISGENKNSKKIAMTIPVTQTNKDGKMYMQFYLPSKFNKETTPLPNNPDLEITTISEGYFAVLKFSGRSSDKNFEKHNEILRKKLLEDKISIKSSPIRATYNSPFTLPPLRRNETMFNIDWKN